MITENDIQSINVIYKSLQCNRKDVKIEATVSVPLVFTMEWNVSGIRQDKKGIKFDIKIVCDSDLNHAELEPVLMVSFIREVTVEEVTNFQSQKLCMRRSAVFINQILTEITSKLGITPMQVSTEWIKDMIEKTTAREVAK